MFKSGPPALFAGVMTDYEQLFPDTNGIGYIVDSAGRHKRTVDLETGAVFSEYIYDLFAGKKYLTAIVDPFNNQVIINHYADGTPYAITSP